MATFAAEADLDFWGQQLHGVGRSYQMSPTNCCFKVYHSESRRWAQYIYDLAAVKKQVKVVGTGAWALAPFFLPMSERSLNRCYKYAIEPNGVAMQLNISGASRDMEPDQHQRSGGGMVTRLRLQVKHLGHHSHLGNDKTLGNRDSHCETARMRYSVRLGIAQRESYYHQQH